MGVAVVFLSLLDFGGALISFFVWGIFQVGIDEWLRSATRTFERWVIGGLVSALTLEWTVASSKPRGVHFSRN